MATKSKARQVKKVLRNADDIIHIFTGKRLKNIVGTGINIFGEELARKAAGVFTGSDEPELPLDSPYLVLGINPDAPDFLLKAAYRANMKKYHPDGGAPDDEMAKKINQAYEQICLEREISK